MNYRKVECPNCSKQFRKDVDADWIVFCSDKCDNESKRNRKTYKTYGGNLRNAS